MLHLFTQKLLQIYLTMETIKLGSFIRLVVFFKIQIFLYLIKLMNFIEIGFIQY